MSLALLRFVEGVATTCSGLPEKHYRSRPLIIKNQTWSECFSARNDRRTEVSRWKWNINFHRWCRIPNHCTHPILRLGLTSPIFVLSHNQLQWILCLYRVLQHRLVFLRWSFCVIRLSNLVLLNPFLLPPSDSLWRRTREEWNEQSWYSSIAFLEVFHHLPFLSEISLTMVRIDEHSYA